MPDRIGAMISSLVAAAVAVACGALAAPAAAQLAPGDIVVADATANPDGAPGVGAIFKVDPTTGAATVLGEHPDFAAPRGVAIDASGNVLVADPFAQPPGEPGSGAIFRIVPGQAPTVFATSVLFADPTGVAVDGAGNVLVADLTADPEVTAGNTGAVFRFAPGNPPATLDAGAQYVEPWGVAVDGQGDVLVADRDAAGGSIIKFTPGGGDGVAFASGFDDPSGVTVGPTGQILVVDPDATGPGNPPFSGEISSVSPAGVVTDLPSAGFSDPFGVDIDSSGRAVVADSSIDPNGGMPGLGAILRFVPGQAPAVLSASTQFAQPGAVAVVPGAPVVDTLPTITPPAGKKKCKKGQKLVKGKCRKKKKKKRR